MEQSYNVKDLMSTQSFKRIENYMIQFINDLLQNKIQNFLTGGFSLEDRFKSNTDHWKLKFLTLKG
jgi:hypothetical protein